MIVVDDRESTLRIRFVLKPHDRVVGKAHHERAAAHSRLHHFGEPLVEHIVKVDITELRRDYAANNSDKSAVNWGLGIPRKCVTAAFHGSVTAEISLFVDVELAFTVHTERRR